MSVRVLVAEDTEHVRTMLVEMLRLDGFTVVGSAADGAEAVAVTRETDPDVVVMDLRMPGMDGLAATRAIRAERPEQAVILYTAYLDPVVEQAARAAGVAICVEKTGGLQQLEREISRMALALVVDDTPP